MKNLILFSLFMVSAHSMEWETARRAGNIEDRRDPNQISYRNHSVQDLREDWAMKYCPRCLMDPNKNLVLNSTSILNKMTYKNLGQVTFIKSELRNSIIRISVTSSKSLSVFDFSQICGMYFPKHPLAEVVSREPIRTFNSNRYELKCSIIQRLFETGQSGIRKNLRVNDSDRGIINKDATKSTGERRSSSVTPQ